MEGGAVPSRTATWGLRGVGERVGGGDKVGGGPGREEVFGPAPAFPRAWGPGDRLLPAGRASSNPSHLGGEPAVGMAGLATELPTLIAGGLDFLG